MNELLAIILIVFICGAMFLAWLISMATCPDRMVNLISNGSGSSTSSSRNESCELVSKDEEAGFVNGGAAPANGSLPDLVTFVANKPIIKSTSKKLSVVPEQDEQLTLQSNKAQKHASILDAHMEGGFPGQTPPFLVARFSDSHIDQIDESPEPPPTFDFDLQPVTLPARIPVSSGGPVAVNQPYSQVGDRVFKCYSVAFMNQTNVR